MTITSGIGIPMADLHSHLLPGVDDGSRTIAQSVRVLDLMGKSHTSDVCLTPHLRSSQLSPDVLANQLSLHDHAFDELSAQAPVLPRMHRGVELMVEGPLPRDAALDRTLCLAGSRYILIEFPLELNATSIRALIGLFTRRGLVPLIAHAERYSIATPAEVFVWKDLGAAIQVDAHTLALARGSRGTRAKALVGSGLADVIAADNHGDERTLAAPWTYLTQIGANVQAECLLAINPQAILADFALEPVPPLVRQPPFRSFLRFFRRS
jgi:protein-tyrosine phosphatase